MLKALTRKLLKIMMAALSSLGTLVSLDPRISEAISSQTLITDGTTLLGADIKSGIAEIMTAIST